MNDEKRITVGAVFLAFLRLGLTSFGGPVAHIGYFHEEFVVRRKWLEERAYADLVALCQFLPGPASSQVGIGIGLSKAGLPGAVAFRTGGGDRCRRSGWLGHLARRCANGPCRFGRPN
jgi:chromate transport protein ChrA